MKIRDRAVPKKEVMWDETEFFLARYLFILGVIDREVMDEFYFRFETEMARRENEETMMRLYAFLNRRRYKW